MRFRVEVSCGRGRTRGVSCGPHQVFCTRRTRGGGSCSEVSQLLTLGEGSQFLTRGVNCSRSARIVGSARGGGSCSRSVSRARPTKRVRQEHVHPLLSMLSMLSRDRLSPLSPRCSHEQRVESRPRLTIWGRALTRADRKRDAGEWQRPLAWSHLLKFLGSGLANQARQGSSSLQSCCSSLIVLL